MVIIFFYPLILTIWNITTDLFAGKYVFAIANPNSEGSNWVFEMDRLIHEWIKIRPFHSLASFKRLRELSMAVKFEPKRQPLKNIHEIRRGVALLPSKSMNVLELWIYLSLNRAILCKRLLFRTKWCDHYNTYNWFSVNYLKFQKKIISW